MAAFRSRQQADLVRRRKTFVERMEARQGENYAGSGSGSGNGSGESSVGEDGGVVGEGDGEEGWRNSEGERLGDFGVDEEVEFYDEEDDVPLSQLLARKRAASQGY